MIVGCQEDTLTVPFKKDWHKGSIGIFIVSIDMFSILLMYKFFSKLKEINDEYTTKIDDMTI